MRCHLRQFAGWALACSAIWLGCAAVGAVAAPPPPPQQSAPAPQPSAERWLSPPSGSPLRAPSPWPNFNAPSSLPRNYTPPSDPTAEPQRSDWGALDQPVIAPAPPPTENYFLVGPAIGVLQHGENQIYRRPVNNPNDVAFDDAHFNMPINIDRPDGLAPNGVQYDHTLKGGGTMLVSYRYFMTDFSGNMVGTHQVSQASVLSRFPIAPRTMTQERHLLLFEYGVTDDLTLTANLPFPQTAINHDTLAGPPIRDNNINPGDIPISGVYVLHRGDRSQLHMNFGLSVPVGLIDNELQPVTPTSPNFSYPLRAGSGTWDLLPGLTWRKQTDRWTFGAQGTGIVRTGLNRYNYRLGDQGDLTAWLSRRWTERISTSSRIDYQFVENIVGADHRLNQALVPTNDPNLQAFQRTNLLFGLNYYIPDGRFPGQRLSVEAGFPIFQWVAGPQLGSRWTINTGWNLIW